MNILDKIVTEKVQEVALHKAAKSIDDLTKMELFERKTFSLKDAILSGDNSKIIAEYKRQSPSKGIINGSAKVEDVTKAYTEHGAACLSVLTDYPFFGGTMEDLGKARFNDIPILRKDFMVDSYQVYEAKAIGADVILLIAACLTPHKVKELTNVAHDLGLEVLLELYTEDELDCYYDEVDLVGVNNRNLKTFEVNIENSIRLLNKLPKEKPGIAESGIDNPQVVMELKNAGFKGFLMGEHFMKTNNPGQAFVNYVNELKSLENAR